MESGASSGMDFMTQLNVKFVEMINKLRSSQSSIGFAESCTGGKLSAGLTEISGVSDVYMGSVVCYSNSAKEDILGVLRDSIINYGAVSEVVALQMAKGACRVLKTDWSVAITGVAGPSGGTELKPVGTVCFGLVGPSVESTVKKQFKGNRVEIQNQAVEYSVDFVIAALKKHKE